MFFYKKKTKKKLFHWLLFFVEQKQRALVPVIWEHCEVPLMLRNMPKIVFRKDDNQLWNDLMWENLINSLLPKSDIIMFLSSSSCNANLTTEDFSADTLKKCSDSGVYCRKVIDFSEIKYLISSPSKHVYFISHVYRKIIFFNLFSDIAFI